MACSEGLIDMSIPTCSQPGTHFSFHSVSRRQIPGPGGGLTLSSTLPLSTGFVPLPLYDRGGHRREALQLLQMNCVWVPAIFPRWTCKVLCCYLILSCMYSVINISTTQQQFGNMITWVRLFLQLEGPAYMAWPRYKAPRPAGRLFSGYPPLPAALGTIVHMTNGCLRVQAEHTCLHVTNECLRLQAEHTCLNLQFGWYSTSRFPYLPQRWETHLHCSDVWVVAWQCVQNVTLRALPVNTWLYRCGSIFDHWVLCGGNIVQTPRRLFKFFLGPHYC